MKTFTRVNFFQLAQASVKNRYYYNAAAAGGGKCVQVQCKSSRKRCSYFVAVSCPVCMLRKVITHLINEILFGVRINLFLPHDASMV